MSGEELGQMVQQIQGSTPLKVPNVRYNTIKGKCCGYGTNGFTMSNLEYPVGTIISLLPDLSFESGLVNCENMQLSFIKELYQVADGMLFKKINKVSSLINPDQFKLSMDGQINSVQFFIGPRKIGFLNRWFTSFSKSYEVFEIRNENAKSVSDPKNILADRIAVCVYDSNAIYMINFDSLASPINTKSSILFSVFNNISGDLETLNVACQFNSNMGNAASLKSDFQTKSNNLKLHVDKLHYNVDEIQNKYGRRAVISLLGYTALVLNTIYQYLLLFITNDSHAAIISLTLLLLFSSNIAYLLHLLLALLRALRRKDNKHINDNQDGITSFIMSIMRNWQYVYSIFSFYAIYGMTVSKNVLQYLTINHGTWLNGGNTVLEHDNTLRFLVTNYGYISIMKLLVIALFTSKQTYLILTKQTPLKMAHGVGAAIVMAVTYHGAHSYSFMLVLILGNVISMIKEAIESNLGYVKK